MNTVFELLIDEAIPGHFYWTIVWIGAAGDLPRVIACAPGPMPSYGAASARGQEALRVVQQSRPTDTQSPQPRSDRNPDSVRGSL